MSTPRIDNLPINSATYTWIFKKTHRITGGYHARME